MKLALALATALLATPAAAQSPVKPTALLFNGLAQYQPGFLTPLAALVDWAYANHPAIRAAREDFARAA